MLFDESKKNRAIKIDLKIGPKLPRKGLFLSRVYALIRE